MTTPPENAVQPASSADWRRWLEAHHARDEGVWLIRFKKSAPRSNLDLETAIEEALCFGWIDSLPRALDDERTMLWFAPRTPGSGWSRINKERVARLEAAGRLAPAGTAKIEAAKADGSWTALDAIETLEVPDDLAAAFERHPGSRAAWDAFPRSARRGILEWISTAKRQATRTRRIDETAELAARGERANQWPRTKSSSATPGG
ncbi:MAG: YdeI/OmpD-associated family protein [Acidobacteriota bacterium]